MKKVAWEILMVFLWIAVFTGNSGAEGFFHTAGRDILDPQGKPFRIRGISPSGWYSPEAYMLRLDAVHNRHIGSYSDIANRIQEILNDEQKVQLFWETYRSNFFTEADVAHLAAQGFNALRIPINYRMLTPEDQPGVYAEAGFQALDRVVQWCKNHGLYVVLDLHACPGGQSHDRPADPEWTYWYWDDSIQNWLETGVACLWESNAEYYAATGRDPEFNKQRTIDLWQTIANRYKDEPAIIGYELINEPYLPWGIHWPVLRDLLIRITAAIREVDTNHIIFAEGNFYASTFEGLIPLWDDNMVLVFHKYWRPTTYEEIAQYVEASISNNFPIVMAESGENSNPWFYEFKSLLESNNVGWFWWGWKKVDSIACEYSAKITRDYQYVIDNFRDSPVDSDRAFSGLMDLAYNVSSGVCDRRPGFTRSLLDDSFGVLPQPFAVHLVPGEIPCVQYDIGHQGVAYWDMRYKNEEDYSGDPWNEGWSYRNDGVDITTTSEGIGYKVGWTEAGEWLEYTVQIVTSGTYDCSIRVATPVSGCQISLSLDGADLTGAVSVPNTHGWEKWRTVTVDGLQLPAGIHHLRLQILSGSVDLAYIRFDASGSGDDKPGKGGGRKK